MEPGAPTPTVFGNGRELYVAYWARNPKFPGYNSGASFDHPGFRHEVAILKFNASLFRFGYPNEEALAGHPLHKFGLNLYGFHIVENSPLIEELATQNKVHSMNDPAHWKKLSHWLITFHDETLEVVGRDASVLPLVEDSNPEEALWHLKRVILPKQRQEAADLAFFQSLEGEVADELCSHEGCSKNRISLSVMCRRHHFEMVMKKPCPFL